MDQIFCVPVASEDRGVNDPKADPAEGERRLAHALDGRKAPCLAFDDPALSDPASPHLELRLNEADELPAASKDPINGGENQGLGDKRDVHRHKRGRLGEILWIKETRVVIFINRNATVAPQKIGKLTASAIKRVNMPRAATEQAVGKAAAGCTDIECDPPLG